MPNANLILDTNVFVQLYSIHDLSEAGSKGNLQDPEFLSRRRRMREALLFACLCHRDGLATGSVLNEPLRILLSRVPPEVDTLETYYTTAFIHFVQERVLSAWQVGWLNDYDDTSLVGTRVDDLLLEAARKEGLPLVTDEGNTKDGIRPEGLRKKAIAAGVDVYTPGEFLALHKLDAARAAAEFFARFDAERPAYFETHPNADEVLAAFLDDLRRILAFVFEGPQCLSS